MKKSLALLLVLLVALAISAPLFAAAETAADPPAPDTPAVVMDLETPVVQTATSEAAETDPGGWFQIDLTALLTWIMQALVLPILYQGAKWIKTRVGERNFDLLMSAVTLGVNAAEEKFKSGHGDEKYNYVVDYLRRRKLSFDEAEIKAVVFNEFNKYKEMIQNE